MSATARPRLACLLSTGTKHCIIASRPQELQSSLSSIALKSNMCCSPQQGVAGTPPRCHLRCMMRRSGRETVMGRKLAAAGRTFSWAWGGRPAGYGPSVRGTSDKLLRWRRQQARCSLRFCFCHELADASSFFLQGRLGCSDYHGPWGEIRSSWCGICRVPCRLLAWSFQKQQCLHALTTPLLRLYQDYCGMCACYVSMRWLAIGQ
jgi:hypothetical protein